MILLSLFAILLFIRLSSYLAKLKRLFLISRCSNDYFIFRSALTIFLISFHSNDYSTSVRHSWVPFINFSLLSLLSSLLFGSPYRPVSLGFKVFYVCSANSRGVLTPSSVHRTFSVRLIRFTLIGLRVQSFVFIVQLIFYLLYRRQHRLDILRELFEDF